MGTPIATHFELRTFMGIELLLAVSPNRSSGGAYSYQPGRSDGGYPDDEIATLAPEGAVAVPRPLLGLNRIEVSAEPPTLNGRSTVAAPAVLSQLPQGTSTRDLRPVSY